MTETTLPKRSFLNIVAEITRILLSILLAILFVIVLSATLVGRASYDFLRQPDSYTTLANQTQLTTRLRGVVVSTLISATFKDNPLFNVIDWQKYPPQTWDNIAAVLLPAGWLDANYNRLVQTLLAWMNGDNSALPSFSLDLTPLKKTLSGSNGALVILPLLQDIPICAQGEVSQFGLGGVINCLPTDQDLSLIAGQVSALVAMQFPDQVSLQSDALLSPAMQQSLENVRTAYKTTGLALTLGLRLALLLLAIYALLQSASLPRLLRNLGWPLYAAGLALLLLLGFLYLGTQWGAGLLGASLQPISGLQTGLSDLLPDILRVMSGIVQTRLLAYGLGLLAAAVVVQILAFALVKLGPGGRPAAAPAESGHSQGIRKQFR